MTSGAVKGTVFVRVGAEGLGLPEAADCVPVEDRIGRDDHEVARERLSCQYPIERVAVRTGQSARAPGIVYADR